MSDEEAYNEDYNDESCTHTAGMIGIAPAPNWYILMRFIQWWIMLN